MASINDLDNPLLVLILNRLCIQKLFTAGHVCVRWNAMRDMSLSERKELILMVGNDAKRYIDESGLQIPEKDRLVDDNEDAMFQDQKEIQLQIHSFPMDFVRLLSTHFTNLTTLTISSQVYGKDLDSIIYLLEQFNRPNLTLQTLKLYSNQNNNRNKESNKNIRTYLRLLSTVNSIGSLRKLTFDVNTKFVRNDRSPRIHLPILSQLDEFEFNSADEFSCLYDSIIRYAVNNQRLRRIGIQLQTSHFTWLLSLSTEISSRFTHLHICLHYINNDLFERLCRHFSHLTSLEITLDQERFTIFSLFRPLTHLTNLLSLVVNINPYGMYYSSVAPNAGGIMHFELPSVKVLTIKITPSHSATICHRFFHHCNMIRVFPNVQVVRVSRVDSICRDCEIKKHTNGAEDRIVALENHCARHMFRHFTHNQHLRMVCSEVVGDEAVGPRYRKWAWDEVEPFEEEREELGEGVENEDDQYNNRRLLILGTPIWG